MCLYSRRYLAGTYDSLCYDSKMLEVTWLELHAFVKNVIHYVGTWFLSGLQEESGLTGLQTGLGTPVKELPASFLDWSQDKFVKEKQFVLLDYVEHVAMNELLHLCVMWLLLMINCNVKRCQVAFVCAFSGVSERSNVFWCCVNERFGDLCCCDHC